jgi:hypothetical protein
VAVLDATMHQLLAAVLVPEFAMQEYPSPGPDVRLAGTDHGLALAATKTNDYCYY